MTQAGFPASLTECPSSVRWGWHSPSAQSRFAIVEGTTNEGLRPEG
jgi:hypothetical protein